MTGPTNEILAERIKNLKKELETLKAETREEIKELEKEVDIARRVADEVNNSSKYMRETVSEMKEMMNGFFGIVNQQSEKIDDFINSEKRMDSKKQLFVSIAQVASGIIMTLIGLWATGKM